MPRRRCDHRSAKYCVAKALRDNVDVRLPGTERQRRCYARNANEKCTESRDVDNEGSGVAKTDRRPLSRRLTRPRSRDHPATHYLCDALEPEDGSHPERHWSVGRARAVRPGISPPSTDRLPSGNGNAGKTSRPPPLPCPLPPHWLPVHRPPSGKTAGAGQARAPSAREATDAAPSEPHPRTVPAAKGRVRGRHRVRTALRCTARAPVGPPCPRN